MSDLDGNMEPDNTAALMAIEENLQANSSDVLEYPNDGTETNNTVLTTVDDSFQIDAGESLSLAGSDLLSSSTSASTSTDAALAQSIDSLVSAMATFEPASAATIGNLTGDQPPTCPIMLAVTN